jgi:hypothetical protein
VQFNIVAVGARNLCSVVWRLLFVVKAVVVDKCFASEYYFLRRRIMASTIKEKAADAGHAVADAAKNVGHKIAEGTEKAVDFVKEKMGIGGPAEGTNVGIAGIREHMDVIASCGKKIGVVDRIEGNAIKLTKNASPDGQHHFIPTGWVDRVDSQVHLTKNSMETEQGWKSDAMSCSYPS